MVIEEVASDLPYEKPHHVDLDLTRYQNKQVNLFYSWMVLWCRRHCKSSWSVKLVEEPRSIQLQLAFGDGREAIYFKMSPEYDAGLRRQKTHFLTAFLTITSTDTRVAVH